MRKAIIAAIVASALFAVGAFAASFTVSSEDVASGAGAVERCAGYVEIEFGDPTPPSDTQADWTVTSATATFYQAASSETPTDACDGFTAELAIFAENVPFNGATPVTVASGVATFSSFAAQPVGPITGAAVMVDGVLLDASFTEPPAA